MSKIIVRTLPAALAVAFACVGMSAVAQTETQKLEKDADKAWDSTKKGTEKAWDSTKSGTKKAAHATEKGAKKAGQAVDDVASDAASGTRKAGDKIGEQIPGTEQNAAAKKAAPKP
jgi:hypothetical protein